MFGKLSRRIVGNLGNPMRVPEGPHEYKGEQSDVGVGFFGANTVFNNQSLGS